MIRSIALAMVLGAALLVSSSSPASADPSPDSEAVIAVTFNADCTGFTATSSKDISYVEIHFADGSFVKYELDDDDRDDEGDHDEDAGDDGASAPLPYSYLGAAAIDHVTVKSGTTVQTFPCAAAPPHGQD